MGETGEAIGGVSRNGEQRPFYLASDALLGEGRDENLAPYLTWCCRQYLNNFKRHPGLAARRTRAPLPWPKSNGRSRETLTLV